MSRETLRKHISSLFDALAEKGFDWEFTHPQGTPVNARESINNYVQHNSGSNQYIPTSSLSVETIVYLDNLFWRRVTCCFHLAYNGDKGFNVTQLQVRDENGAGKTISQTFPVESMENIPSRRNLLVSLGIPHRKLPVVQWGLLEHHIHQMGELFDQKLYDKPFVANGMFPGSVRYTLNAHYEWLANQHNGDRYFNSVALTTCAGFDYTSNTGVGCHFELNYYPAAGFIVNHAVIVNMGPGQVLLHQQRLHIKNDSDIPNMEEANKLVGYEGRKIGTKRGL